MAWTLWTRWRAARFLFLLAGLSAAAAPAAAVSFVPRYHHSATLLPNRDVLLCGGSISSAGSVTTGCQLFRESQGDYAATGSMTVARASHTATLLPNGKVLIAGGHTGAAAVNTAELYDPVAGTFGGVLGSVMSAARSNHTATLLATGKVLICGGQNAPATVTGTCDLFDPASNAFAATGGLQAGRSAHTATLLRDGRVFIAGGYDPAASPAYLVTTEVYNPVAGGFTAAHSLIAARAYHSATMMGGGKVFIAGGFNGKNLIENRGILDSTEIYDPVADSMVPAAKMKVRRLGHTATLDNDGGIDVFGGLGNMTTSYNPVSSELLAISSVAGTVTGTLGTLNVTGGSLSFELELNLGVKASGIIQNGDAYFSLPTADWSDGKISLTPGNTGNNAVGLRANLDGTAVVCDASGVCGKIIRNVVPLNMQGQYTVNDVTANIVEDFTITGGRLVFPGTLNSANNSINLDYGTTIIGSGRLIGLSSRFIGATISSGAYILTAGAFVQSSSYTVTLTRGFFNIPAVTVIDDGNGGAETGYFTIRIGSVTGTVDWNGSDAMAFTSHQLPLVPAPKMTGVVGRMKWSPNRVDLADLIFTSDVATVVIRGMMFSDLERYTPFSNDWAYTNQRFGLQAYNQTAIRAPNGELRIHGGRACSLALVNSSCARVEASTSAAILPVLGNWTTLTSSLLTGGRGHHTATTLPDGKILIAGGANGPNILATAEVFDPATELFTQTGSMSAVRDLHSATLLPNGRVLAAGGFSTSATSSGATKTAEIYYPDTGVWLPTEVMTSSRSLHTATLLPDGNVLVVGGLANGLYQNTAEIYYSTSATWSQTASLPAGEKRAQHSATLLRNGKVLVVGGVNAAGILGSAYLFDPASGAWTAAASLAGGAHSHSHSASLLLDGRVLVAGGGDEYGELAQSQIYDPAADAWTPTGSPPNVPRFNHAANILPNGNVVISGGAIEGSVVGQAETFSIAYSTWTLGGNLATARGYHTMTLAKNGFLYAIGGYDGVNYLPSVEKVYFTGFPDLRTTGAPPSTRQPSITASDRAVFDRNELLNVTGNNFHGATEGSGGGSGGMNSSHATPAMVLEAVGGSGGTGSQGNSGFILDMTQKVFVSTADWSVSNTSVTVLLPGSTQLPYGWYHLRMGVNAQYSDSVLVQAGPPKPTQRVADVTGVVVGASSVTWSWPAVGGVFDGYNIYSAVTGVFLASSPVAASPSFTQRNLLPNTSAQIQVAPYTLTGDGPVRQSEAFFMAAPIPASTATTANVPANLTLVNASASGLDVSWSKNGNGPTVTYQVTYSSDDFVGHIATAVPFSLGFNGATASLSGLLSSTLYSIRVAARDAAGLETGFSNILAAHTTNGGAAPGALAGVLSSNSNSVVSGSISSLPQRTIYLQAPAGTFPSDVNVTISSVDVTGNTLCANPAAIGVSVSVDPPLQPDKTVYLTISYTNAEIGALPTDRLVLARHEPALGKCVPLQTNVDTTAHTITAALGHFSVFQVAAVQPAVSSDDARVFPNPWYAGRTGQVTFHQMPAGARVRIFTLKGELAADLRANASGLLAWDGLNRGGRKVASGVYLVVIEGSAGPKKTLKLVVLR